MVKNAQYIKTLHFLNERKPDRFYLNEFTKDSNNQIINLQNNQSEIILDQSFHENYFEFNNTSEIIFCFDIFRLDKFNQIHIYIKTSEKLDLDSIDGFFSQHPKGIIPYQYVQLNEKETSVTDDLISLVFDIVDEDGADNSRFLHNIRTFHLDLGERYDVEIHDIFVHQTEYELTLEDIDNAIAFAVDYLSRDLDEAGLKTLEHLIYKVAAAKLWLIKWNEEGESASGVGSFSSKSYHDKLMEEVEKELAEYQDSIDENEDKKYINTRLVGCLW